MTDVFWTRALRTSLLLLTLTSPLWAQDLPPDEPEAPEAIFDQKIGDVGVLLDAEGTWTTRLSGGTGAGFSSVGTLAGLGYPGFEKGVVFDQEPDFSLTLRLLERYYLEIVWGGSFDERSFLVGYDGRPDEFVQWIKAGNEAFSVPARAGQTLADGRRGAPAVGGAFSAGPVSFEVLGRYEDGSRESVTYVGSREAGSATVGLESWIRGRFFRLPGPYPLSGVRILVADASGDLGSGPDRFRAAGAGEAVFDDATGQVWLPAPAAKRYLVTWSGAPGSPSPTLGLSPTLGPSAVAGTWYVLAVPGAPSAFELRNRYPLTAGTEGAVLLVDAEGLPVAGRTVTQAPSQDWFEVSGDPEAPFLSDFPGLYPTGLAGDAPPLPSVLPWVFRLPSGPAKGYSLGSDVLASSLVVLRNGVPTDAWTYDAASGTVRFTMPIFDSDTVTFSFQRQQAAAKATELVLWQGGRWDLGAGQNVEWNLQGRWNMEQGQFTTEDLQSPGRMAASLLWSGASEGWTWSVSATGGALLADSTGHRQIFGPNANGAEASYNSTTVRPAAAPGDLSALGLATLSSANRTEAWYRDHWTSDPLTGAPQVGAWGQPGVERSDSGITGPYLVRGDGTKTTRMAVIETTPTASGQWAGVELFLDQGKAQDLSAASAVTIELRVPEGLGTSHLVFQAGRLSTDFDGTGLVRRVEYRDVPGLTFVSDGARAFFPLPEGSPWGNDTGTGVPAVDGALVTRELTPSTVSTGWQTLRLELTDAERQRLASASGWRLVLVSGAAAPAGQSVLVGPVVFERARWSVVADGSASGSVNPAEQTDASGNPVLRLDWNGRSAWAVEEKHSPVRPASYRTLAFRYRFTSGGGGDATLRLTDPQGNGLRATWTTGATTSWVNATIDLATQTLSLDGTPTGTVTIDTGAGEWDRMRVSYADPGPGTGTWYLDEVSAQDPVWEPIATSLATVRWRQATPWPALAQPWVTGTEVSLTSSQTGVTSADLLWKGVGTLATNLGPVRAWGEASVTRTASSVEPHGAYEATLPLGWSGGPSLSYTERFADSGLRAERVSLVLPWLGTWDASVAADGPPVQLNQTYKASWNASGPWGATAAASVEWDQSRPWTGVLRSFAQQWTDSWGWLAPGTALAPWQLLKADTAWGLAPGPVSLSLRAAGRVSQSVGATTAWSPAGDWSVQLPLQPGTGWTLTPSVSRHAEAVYDLAEGLSPMASGGRAAARLLGPASGLVALPFSELTAAPWTDGVRSGLVTSSATLDAARTASGDWVDLALPLTGGLKVTSTGGREGAASYWASGASAHMETRALNLFGDLGAVRVFPWYRTDGFTWSLAGAWGTGSRDSDRSWNVAAAERTDLIFTTEERAALPLTLETKQGTVTATTVTVKPTWSLRQAAALPFELPRWLSPKAFKRQWTMDVTTALSLGWQPEPAPVVRDLQVSWKGALTLSEKSELSLTTRWGQQWQEGLSVLGLEAVLELVLSF